MPASPTSSCPCFLFVVVPPLRRVSTSSCHSVLPPSSLPLSPHSHHTGDDLTTLPCPLLRRGCDSTSFFVVVVSHFVLSVPSLPLDPPTPLTSAYAHKPQRNGCEKVDHLLLGGPHGGAHFMPCLVSCFLFELVHGNVTEWCKTMSNHWILCTITGYCLHHVISLIISGDTIYSIALYYYFQYNLILFTVLQCFTIYTIRLYYLQYCIV